MCGQITSVLVLCNAPVCGDSHKGLSGTALKRQVVLNHLEKFAVLKFILRCDEQPTAFDDGLNAFPLASGDPLGIFGRGVLGDAVGRHHVAYELRNVAHAKDRLLLAKTDELRLWLVQAGSARYKAWKNPLPLAAGNAPEGKQALLRLWQSLNPLLRAAGKFDSTIS